MITAFDNVTVVRLHNVTRNYSTKAPREPLMTSWTSESEPSSSCRLGVIPVFLLALSITLALVVFPRSPETPPPFKEKEVSWTHITLLSQPAAVQLQLTAHRPSSSPIKDMKWKLLLFYFVKGSQKPFSFPSTAAKSSNSTPPLWVQ